jgi:hypothetical protein
MPYRLNPSNKREIQVKRAGKWLRFRLHSTVGKAAAHLKALRTNVEEA